MVIRLLLPIALLGNGLAAGGLMIAVLGGAPFLLSLPVDRYIPAHQFMVTRFDPFMPACMLTALAVDIVLAATADGAGYAVLFSVAIVFLTGAMAVSLAKNVPINRWIARVNPSAVPGNWDDIDPRVEWSNWNRVRTLFVLCALADTCVIAGLRV